MGWHSGTLAFGNNIRRNKHPSDNLVSRIASLGQRRDGARDNPFGMCGKSYPREATQPRSTARKESKLTRYGFRSESFNLRKPYLLVAHLFVQS